MHQGPQRKRKRPALQQLGAGVGLFLLLSLGPVQADQGALWLARWNAEKGREVTLKSEDVLFQPADSELFPSLLSAGFRQSDGSYLLGKVIWRNQDYTPLPGLAKVLADVGFVQMSDLERERAFLALLQQTYGKLGVRPYTGEDLRTVDRPAPIRALRGPDGSHRFQVWYYEFPVATADGEWREVLYLVSRDASQLIARTLGSHRPELERLKGFPTPSSTLFE